MMKDVKKSERLDKIIASQGLVSRSEVKQLIRRGEVTVNGEVIKDSSVKVFYDDVISVCGQLLFQTKNTYIMLNKPKGVVSSTDDRRDKTVVDILPEELKRKNLFPAGRLDKDTTGFCLITDDGEFAHSILAPSRHVTKTYIAEVDKPIDVINAKKAFNEGIVLADGTVLLKALLDEIPHEDKLLFKVVIKEGKYHQVKRMFAARGKHVTALHRLSIGGLSLDEKLAPGQFRELTEEERLKIFGRDFI